MRLPNVNSAIVTQSKVAGYLLNPAHATGASKAAFFMRFGFGADEWRQLAEALLQHAAENEVARMESTHYGTRYVVDGPLRSPSGHVLNIRSAWFIDVGSEILRFVTAHPLPRK
jgi:hypothetical protein